MRTKYLFSFLCALICASTISAQGPRQVIIANGNLFQAGNYATMASYNPGNQSYYIFDSIPARFVSDVIVDGNQAYVAADSFLLRYDLDLMGLTATGGPAFGIRKLARWNNLLLFSTGVNGDPGARFIAYNVNTWQFAFAIPGISGECEGIVVHGDTAYVAVPGSFGSPTGSIALIDLNAGSLMTEISLDTMGRGIDRMYVSGGKIWAVNSIAYANPWGIVTELDPTTRSMVHHRVELNTQHSPGLHNNLLYLRRGEGVFAFDPNTGTVVDSLFIAGNFAGGVIDTVNSEFYLTETDYFSYGTLRRFNAQGMLLDSLPIGISPEVMAIDYRLPVAIEDAAETGKMQLWPVPTRDVLNLALPKPAAAFTVTLTDIQGRTLIQNSYRHTATASLNVSELPSGMYLVSAKGKGVNFQSRISK